ncbi:MAG: FHA domain-containing protein [Gammaproteobacteria bacterium]|nr:MAG: FHA domain-containing protein [Gammaproteobacteria bacterium]
MANPVVLKVTQGALEGKSFSFPERTTCIVGRAKDCNIKLPDDKHHETISRYHCRLEINPPNIRIRDFGSRNGTYVNGNKIGQRKSGLSVEQAVIDHSPEYDLSNGDEIKVGQTVFSVDTGDADIETDQTVVSVEDEKTTLSHFPDTSEVNEQIHQFPELQGISDFTAIKELGRGGMGAVFLTRNNQTGEEVALKVMLPQVAVNDFARNMFLRETRNTQVLNHPNVVKLLSSQSHGDIFYFTMEYCNRGSLNDLAKQRGGKLSVDEAMPLMLQALDGLQYAHTVEIPSAEQSDEVSVAMYLKDGAKQETSKGLVHRDLKPANIYLSEQSGELIAKVGDFGLAKAFDTSGLSGQTLTGGVGGSPIFMPRQQILNFKYSKPEVDVWAMMATFYKMLTGTYPRDFPRNQDPWLTALKNAPVPVRQRNPDIPPRLAEVIDEALIDEPDLRFHTADQLSQAIKSVL